MISENKIKNQNWCEKYRAECFTDIKGQDVAITQIKHFFKNFPRKKAILVFGPAGIGKTSLAYALAKDTKSEIFELNASDLRNREKLHIILKPALEQKSLFLKNKVILIDEIDSISSDTGGLLELLALIEKTNFPIIITGNNIWHQKLNTLRIRCQLIELKELGYKTIYEIIEKISEKEKIKKISKLNELLKSIAIRARGDVRAAINDLQSIIVQEETGYELHERDKEESIFNVLRIIFKSKSNSELLNLFEKVNMPFDDVVLWIEENIPYEYQGKELVKAFEALSKADVFRGRIHRQQHWRFLVYQNALLSAGIAAAKKQSKSMDDFTIYKKPSRILKIWISNQKNSRKKTIMMKYAKATHCSKKRAIKEFFIFKLIAKNKKIQKELKLQEQEIDFLKEPTRKS